MKLSTTNPTITQTNSGLVEIFDFGNIHKNSPAIVNVDLTGENISEAKIKSTCGCTAGLPQRIDENKTVFTIQYKNTHLTKSFGIILNYSAKENGQLKTGQIKIKGNVI